MPAGVLGNTAQESWWALPWRPVPSTTKKFPDRSRIPVDIPTGWEPPWPYGLHLLIFPQPLGRALKNQNAAPTTPPCFCRRQRSSSLLFESCTVHHKKSPDRSRIPVDIPTGWEPRTNQSPTGALIAFAALGTCCSRPVPSTTKKSPDRMVWGCGGAFSTALEPKTSSREMVLESSVKLKLSTTRSSKT